MSGASVESFTGAAPRAQGPRGPLRAFRVREAVLVDDDPEVLMGARTSRRLDQCSRCVRTGSRHGAVDGRRGGARKDRARSLPPTGRGRARLTCLSAAPDRWRSTCRTPPGARCSRLCWRSAPAAPSPSESAARLGDIRHPQLAPLDQCRGAGFLEETPLVRSLTGQARADATSSVLSEVIAAHAKNRFVLVLEDCHWMDSASWRLLLRVAQDYPQALIVLTSRPARTCRKLSALRLLEGFAEMKLAPLRPGH